ncbi:pentapeptide repeat-containing protein [Nodosilinea sp. LEGE 07088]|uniref:pentapeptide repeat-containing protein n=1 Tax=Nodosilinea sp. LEGE 07088 TaxID=2777968 RepID=UPI00187EAAB4|nr:pentapeptide repeat-containing protein [Nodosilinea sp. LEGE 07088]MBE9140214.1 pentapeptide repeat-containing protein [Nodosilinea sp. LEGE 07088]
MGERFKQWPSKRQIYKWGVIGAIATPVFLWMVWWLWLLPERRLHPNSDRLSHGERATLADPHRETPTSDLGVIAAVAGGVLLLLNSRRAKSNAETPDLSGADFGGADLNGVDFGGVDLNGTNFSGANLSGADLSEANLNGANLINANLNGANLSGAGLRHANLSGADLRYANLSGADLRYANLSGADLNCTLLSDANLSDANLSGALLFFINSREVLNLEPFQLLKAKPSPFLCNIALPAYSHQPAVNPNRDCDCIPQLLSARYDIPLEEAQGIVDEARQHQWD